MPTHKNVSATFSIYVQPNISNMYRNNFMFITITKKLSYRKRIKYYLISQKVICVLMIKLKNIGILFGRY